MLSRCRGRDRRCSWSLGPRQIDHDTVQQVVIHDRAGRARADQRVAAVVAAECVRHPWRSGCRWCRTSISVSCAPATLTVWIPRDGSPVRRRRRAEPLIIAGVVVGKFSDRDIADAIVGDGVRILRSEDAAGGVADQRVVAVAADDGLRRWISPRGWRNSRPCRRRIRTSRTAPLPAPK